MRPNLKGGLRNARLRVWLFVFPALTILAATLGALILDSHSATVQRREADRRYVQAFDMLLATGGIKSAVNAALRGERGYLLTHDRRFLGPYEESRSEIPKLFNRVEALTRDNERQRSDLERLGRGLASYYALLDRTIALAAAGRGAEAQEIVRRGLGKREIENVLRQIARIEAEEHRLLAQRRAAYAQADRRSEHYGLGLAAAGAAMLALLALAAVTALRANARADEATAELKRIATTDVLTGLWNRRHLLERLEAETGRSLRNGRPLCLAIIDVDHFKRVNDVHGHPGGDEVLRVLAERIKSSVRLSDVVGRMGGEEFAILMPETDRAQARLVCERLRESIAATPIPLPGGAELKVTLSTGIALMAGKEASARLISRADAALYDAKADGRNRVKLAA